MASTVPGGRQRREIAARESKLARPAAKKKAPPAKGGSPPTLKGQRRRAEMLKASKEVFEALGYFDTRVSDIVAHARVSQGTFYIYFDSKDDVLRSLIDELVEDLYRAATAETAAPPDETPYDHLERTIRQFMQIYKANAKMMRILEQVVTFDEDLREIRLGVITRFNEQVCAAIKSLQRRGEGDPDLDARHASLVLGGMVGDCAFALYVLGQDYDEEQAVATMARVWAKAVGIPVTAKPKRSRPRRRVTAQ